MNPLDLRGDIEEARGDPFSRALAASARTDRREEREQAERMAERAAAIEGGLMYQEALDRSQIATRGVSDREMAVRQARAEAARQERIAELEAELDRLDPVRRAARQAEGVRMAKDAADDRLLARATAAGADPFMKQEIRRFHERGAARERADRRAELARLERLTGYSGEITR